MRMLRKIALIVLVASLFLIVALYFSTRITRSLGVPEWGSLDGPQPVWPAVLGFASMYAAAASAALLVVLSLVAAVRSLLDICCRQHPRGRRRRAREAIAARSTALKRANIISRHNNGSALA